MWKKWLVLAQKDFQTSMAYRTEILVWLVLDTLPTVILFVMWDAIFNYTDQVQGYTISGILQYYLLILIINAITASHFELWRVDEIREGKIDHFLLKPLHYVLSLFIQHVSGKTFYLLISLPCFAALWWAAGQLFPLGSLPLTPVTIVQTVYLLVIASMIEFFLAALVVLSSFWLENARGLVHFKWVIIEVFGGLIVPIALMPESLRQIVTKLPFKYMYDVPVSILQGRVSLQLVDIIYTSGFVALLWITTSLVWRRAVMHYSSAGG